MLLPLSKCRFPPPEFPEAERRVAAKWSPSRPACEEKFAGGVREARDGCGPPRAAPNKRLLRVSTHVLFRTVWPGTPARLPDPGDALYLLASRGRRCCCSFPGLASFVRYVLWPLRPRLSFFRELSVRLRDPFELLDKAAIFIFSRPRKQSPRVKQIRNSAACAAVRGKKTPKKHTKSRSFR